MILRYVMELSLYSELKSMNDAWFIPAIQEVKKMINLKYELMKNEAFMAHLEERFYQKDTPVGNTLEEMFSGTKTRELSNAEIYKRLYEEIMYYIDYNIILPLINVDGKEISSIINQRDQINSNFAIIEMLIKIKPNDFDFVFTELLRGIRS